MDEYYKFYESYRFRHVAHAKLAQQNRGIRKNFYIFFFCLIFFLLALPYLQYLYQYIHDCPFHLYNNSPTKSARRVFWDKRVFPFTIIGTFTLIYTYIGSILISRKRTPDQFKKIKLFNKNFYHIGIFFVTCLIINSAVIILLDYGFNDIYRDLKFEPIDELRLLFLFISMFIYTSLIFFIMGVFVMTRNRIKIEIQKQRKAREEISENKYQDAVKSEKYIYIYWAHYIKCLFLKHPIGFIGAIVFIILSMIAFIVRGGNIEIFRHHFIWGVGFYSFWVTSANLAFNPLAVGIRNLGKIYNDYALHIINNSILPNLENHIVIIGIGNLGKQIIKNCFTDIHPEGYGVTSLCLQGDDKAEESKPTVEDYDIIIDKDLSIHTISRRIIVIDKNSNLYKEKFKTIGDIPIVTFEPWIDDEVSMTLIGFCGDANNEYILNSASIKSAEVIINATPDTNLSLLLASKYPGKQLLSVTDSYTFDTLTATTYDRDVFLIDTQSIEGTNLSQLIFHWAYLNIGDNISHRFKNVKDNEFGVNYEILKRNINFKNNNDRYKHEYDEEGITNYENHIIKYCIARYGNGRVLLCGSGRYFTHIIKSFILQIKFEMGLTDGMVRDLIQNKIFILTDNIRILSESEKESEYGKESRYWKFYPLRDRNTVIDSAYKILMYEGKARNFEEYVKVLNSSINSRDKNLYFRKLLPELIVLINSDAYTSIDMFVSASTAIEVVKNSMLKERNIHYNPHILVYSNKEDKTYLNEHFKKYYSFNLMRNEKVGYPTQLMKESRLTKDFGGALQYSSMLKALYISSEENLKSDEEKERVAEISFSVKDIPGSLAYVSASMTGRRLKYSDSYSNENLQVPSFINYFTAEDARYKDTFLFKGFAKLAYAEKIKSFEELVKYCFVNCNEQHRDDITNVLNDNINAKTSDICTDVIDNSYDKLSFSHYPISSILRHPDKHYDIVKRRPRFFSYDTGTSENDANSNQTQIKSYKDLMLLFNVSDFTIWAEGEDNSGSLASVLSQVVLAELEDNGHIRSELNKRYEPVILFSSNKPSLDVECKKGKQNIAQDSFYIKLREKQNDNEPVYDLIRAIKIKISGEIFHENLYWSKYIFNLKRHLIKTSGIYYSIFLIKKTYMEGLITETDEGIIEKSIYKKIDNEEEIKSGGISSFKITRKWNYEQRRPRELPYLDFNNNKSITESLGKDKSQGYEFVIIRDNIIKNANEESTNELNFGTFKNMLYYIDDI